MQRQVVRGLGVHALVFLGSLPCCAVLDGIGGSGAKDSGLRTPADGGEDPRRDAGDKPGEPDAGLPENAVTGTLSGHYVVTNDAVVSMVPDPLDRAEISALVGQDPGNVTIVNGIGKADGTFFIPNVPQGEYYLRIRKSGEVPQYWVTTQRTHALVHYELGRPDVAYPTRSTPVTLELAGLSPWQASDSVCLFSANSAASLVGINRFAMPVGAPTAGATSATLQFDYYGLGVPLSDSGKMDSVFLYQLSTYPFAENLVVSRLNMYVEVFSVRQADGSPSLITATLFPADKFFSFGFAWDRASFNLLANEQLPGGYTQEQVLTVMAVPGPQAHGFGKPEVYPQLSRLVPQTFDSTIMGKLGYDDPLPAAWNRVVVATHRFAANDPGAIRLATIHHVEVLPQMQANLREQRGPVFNVLVDGRDARLNLTAPATLTLSWTAPRDGTGEGWQQVGPYEVKVRRPSTEPVATLFTERAGITLPTGLLSPGLNYIFEITASWAPRPGEFPLEVATLPTGVVTIAGPPGSPTP